MRTRPRRPFTESPWSCRPDFPGLSGSSGRAEARNNTKDSLFDGSGPAFSVFGTVPLLIWPFRGLLCGGPDETMSKSLSGVHDVMKWSVEPGGIHDISKEGLFRDKLNDHHL